MPPRSNPTARQERLGVELRKLREAAGLSAREAGEALGGGQPQISNIESGRYGVSEERVRRLAELYACGDAPLVDALCTMADEVRGKKGWWEEYRGILPTGFLDVAELEHHATRLCAYQISHIPGVFQTEAHIRALFAHAASPLPTDDLDARVAHRLRRSAVIYPGSATEFEAIIHEAALRMRFGGRAVARAQLEQILDVSERDNVHVRVITFEADGFAGSGNAMMYAEGGVPQLDTVQFDSVHGSVFLDAREQLERYRFILDRMRATSLGEDETRTFIHRLARDV
ncbi:helix-turn-helix transcriptional regulator [Streptomyces sp. NPDC005336]|uniref:helix-turn-helix domain-containing protein n=1 Tax=Streptomyces sp. NPDC005336 TaxID=3157035 RepID=UPI0033B187C0